MSPSCGIDFGTTNSTAGLTGPGGPHLIALEGSHLTLPSAVFWDSDGAPPRFGRDAMTAYVEGEDGRLMRGLKATLGSPLIGERTRVGNRTVSFHDIIASVFRRLKSSLDAAAGDNVTRAVLGRPVHFVDGDDAADRAAEAALDGIARAAGFRDIAFQYEPIAAALEYEATVTAEELVLIVDLGGGTSDLSIVRVSPGGAAAADRAGDILANDGIRLGGSDFDRSLSLSEVMPHLGFGTTTKGGQGNMPRHYYLDLATWHRINALYTQRTAADLKALRADADMPDRIDRMIRVVDTHAGHAVAMEVEGAKIALSDAEVARLNLKALTGGPNPLAHRARFEAAIAPGLDRLAGLIGAVLAQAGIPRDRIGTVFLTGGSSHLPAVRALVSAQLPDARLATGDMFASVGAGLVREAARRFGPGQNTTSPAAMPVTPVSRI